ncbi:MAG: mannonate dehydratase [Planctomycetaceae bacterium]|nr:mannonate dehydratase [Planctomycetaceae bacterium]
MRLATVLTPITDEFLQLAAQCGVTDVVDRCRGPEIEAMLESKRWIESYGLELSVIEGYLPFENIKLGIDDGTELEAMKTLIRQMGEAGVPILCYNFMSGTDWVRTSLDAPERGGAKVTGFNLQDAEKAISLTHDGASPDEVAAKSDSVISMDELWDNLERFLNELLPVAEDAGVYLSMHPDDPPLDEVMGRARIMNRLENFERLVALAPSPHNGVCFCQGSFAEIGVDIPEAIRRLGKSINYVHFRDIRGTKESFVETFHDNGPTDMVATMQAYRDVGFDGPIRPDHVPQLVGEDEGEPGYTMKGRLFAYGYMRGLMQATK